MRVVLRGRRSLLLWVLTSAFMIGVSLSALTVALGSPLPSALQARLSALQAEDMVQVVRGYREGERAALLSLEDDVLAQLPVFAQGEALDQLLQRVRTLRANGAYEEMQLDSFKVVQVLENAPYFYVMTSEVLSVVTYPQAIEGAAPSERRTVSLEVVYHLVHAEERWKVTKVVAVEG